MGYRPDVGYVPNMAYLVAVLLLNNDTLESFTCLANLLNRPFFLSFYITDRNEVCHVTRSPPKHIESIAQQERVDYCSSLTTTIDL